MKKLQVKGSFFLKDKGRFFKVITVRPVGDNRYVFGCRELDSEKSEVLTFRLLGLLDAMDAAASVMRDPKDVLLVDLDDQDRWKILSKDELFGGLKKSLYLTNTWYIRFQNYTKGDFSTMPRDGIFLVEKGKNKQSLKDLRVSDNALSMLGNIAGISKERQHVHWWGRRNRRR
jgi:PmbA protein